MWLQITNELKEKKKICLCTHDFVLPLVKLFIHCSGRSARTWARASLVLRVHSFPRLCFILVTGAKRMQIRKKKGVKNCFGIS